MFTLRSQNDDVRRSSDGRKLLLEILEDRRVLSSVTLSDSDFLGSSELPLLGNQTGTAEMAPGGESSEEIRATARSFGVTTAPQAFEDSYDACENGELVIPGARGVLANDHDTDGDELRAVLVRQPSHGTLTLNDDGGFTYSPANHFNREDSFQYMANDGTSNSNIVTVTMTVQTDCPWNNGARSRDVSDDGYISPLDLLLIINVLNSTGSNILPVNRERPLSKPFLDVSDNGFVSPLDALLVINYLNGVGGEGEDSPLVTKAVAATAAEWSDRENIETPVFKFAEVSDQDSVVNGTADDSRESVNNLQSLDLLFAKLDKPQVTESRDSDISRREICAGDLEEFLEDARR